MSDKKITGKLRLKVFYRARHHCEYCMCPSSHSSANFCIEHIVPIAKGGTNDFSNLALSCHGCNGHKHVKTLYTDPLSGESVPLFNPRTQFWKEHFQWNENQTEISGQTPVGRATVNALKMNRKKLVNLRFALNAFGVHPPDHSI